MFAVWSILATAGLVSAMDTFDTDDFKGWSLYPKLTVNIDGVDQEIYVQPTPWSKDVDVDGSSVTYKYNNRMYLSTVDRIDPDKYLKVDLLGGSLEFDLDLSQVGCNCIVALYGVRMPVQDPDSTDEQKYCDGQGVGGSYCPEFDLLEGNLYGIHSTTHPCDLPDADGVYSTCSSGG